MDDFIKVAMAELGQKEIRGPENNPSIVNYAKETDFDWVNDDETPWCSIFINWCCKKSGLKGSGKANARSWMLTGSATSNPEPGDTVVFWREKIDSWKGHVGIFLGFSKDTKRVYCLGGNQGNQVSISAYPVETVLGYRRLTQSQLVSLPEGILKPGTKGDNVKALQNALKLAGFDCGTSDGDYGGKTKDAVIALQATSGNLNPDGIYGSKTRTFLLEILQS
jgi:uncharacterized protein (TIGR02594 family)